MCVCVCVCAQNTSSTVCAVTLTNTLAVLPSSRRLLQANLATDREEVRVSREKRFRVPSLPESSTRTEKRTVLLFNPLGTRSLRLDLSTVV